MTRNLAFARWTAWILAATFYFYEFLLRVSPGVMIADLMQSFQATAASIGILSAFYLYAYAPMQLPVGVLLDRYGLKTILSCASIICGLGALTFALASHLSVACLGRFLIGGASAFAFVALVYVSSHWFPPGKRAFLIGSANSIAMLGASAGMGPLTSVIHRIGWRETIGLFGIFGILLGIAVFAMLSRVHPRAWDLSEEEVKPRLLANLKQAISHRSTWINGIAALLFYVTTTAFAGLWGLSFIQEAYGVSKETAGYAISMVFAGWMAGGPLVGWISDLLKNRTLVIQIGILGTLLCFIWVVYFPVIPIYAVYILLFLLGLFSSAELLNFSLAIELNSPAAKATAAAFTNCLISWGDALVQPLVGFLLDHNWGGTVVNGIRVYQTQDYQIALSCLPIALVLSMIAMFYVRKPHG